MKNHLTVEMIRQAKKILDQNEVSGPFYYLHPDGSCNTRPLTLDELIKKKKKKK